MGSYETIVKLEEMRRKVEEGDLLSALKVLETLELKKIKNMSDLSLIAEVYAGNERYEEAQELYLKIYDKTKSRKALYQLIEVLIKLNNAEGAEHYLKQYQKIAPKDFYNYVFLYKINKINGESYEHLIEILEDLKKTEYTEKWAYELAKLYYKAGMEEECIRECSDIVLWFGEGTYVEKAKILRSYYSGEADKDKIMEEIKRRAELVNSLNEQSARAGEEEEDRPEEVIKEEDPSRVPEEKLYSDADFMLHEGTDAFEDGLKKDVQSILTDEAEASYQKEDTYREDTYKEDAYKKDANKKDAYKEDAYKENAHKKDAYKEDTYFEGEEVSFPENNTSYPEESTYYEEERDTYEAARAFGKNAGGADLAVSYDAGMSPEKEQPGQETDQTDYQLPKEENLDEEDKKLKQLAAKLQIDPQEIFGNFLHVLAVKKQIVKSVSAITNERSKTVMMAVTGIKGSGKTALAKDMALFLYKTGRLKSSKVAKIKADKLNTVDIMSKKETLKDCCMVIEDASELKRRTIDGLLELSGHLQGNIAFIFEEDKKNMNKLFRECPKLMDLLKNRVHLPQYTQEDLFGFVRAGLKQKDYRPDPRAEQILADRVSQIAKTDPKKQLEQIFEMLQSAMDAADIRTGKQLSSLATQGRLKDVEILTVLPEDLQ
jgi:hypothetical protein